MLQALAKSLTRTTPTIPRPLVVTTLGNITATQLNANRFRLSESQFAHLRELSGTARNMTDAPPPGRRGSLSSIGSIAELVGKSAGEDAATTNLPVLTEKEFATLQENLKKENLEPELVGFHGTARWVVDNIKADGFDTGMTGKYRGGKSGGGEGVYTADSAQQDDHAAGKKVAQHYARRASVGEADAFDRNTKPTVLAIYRIPNANLTKAQMPSDILGDPEKVKAFREQNPAHEYDLGQTPVPRRLEGVKANTTLISDHGLGEIDYVAVVVEPDSQKSS